jgi:hypothetical protein
MIDEKNASLHSRVEDSYVIGTPVAQQVRTIFHTAFFFILLTMSGCGGGSQNTEISSPTGGQLTVAITPVRGGLTGGQSLNLTATVAGDSKAAGVTWKATAGTFSSQSSSSAVFVAPSAPGSVTISATSITDATQSASATIGVTNLTGVTTYHNDLARDGVNSQEYALTTSNVTTATFGKIFSCATDGAIYTQPLWVAGLTINKAKHNVIFVATQHDSLYAFDADANPCSTIWHANLIDTAHGGTAGEGPVPEGPPGTPSLVGVGNGSITPEIGVTGTPVIDPSTNTLYVVSKSVIASVPTFFVRLHAIDLTTGNEKFKGPAVITATYPGAAEGGTTVNFSPRTQHQRTGLALVNGVVYVAFASHEDAPQYFGWLLGYSATTLAQVSVLNVSPNVGYGGIWMSGAAPAADSANNLYVITGNGGFDITNPAPPNNDYGDSFVKVTAGSQVTDWFTPTDQQADEANDFDFGSGGAAVLVDQPSGPTPHLMIGGGKDGFAYLLNRDAMGHLGDTNAWQRINVNSAIFSTGAFWNNTYYISVVNNPIAALPLDPTTDLLGAPTSHSPNKYGFPAGTPSISALNTTNGILWELDNATFCTSFSPGCGPAVLHAYDATNLATELWNSSQGSGNTAGNAVKYTVPTVANGKVYIGTRGSDNSAGGIGEMDVYGLLSN